MFQSGRSAEALHDLKGTKILLEMSYESRRNLGACKSNYIAIQSCLGYTGLVLQAEEQMLD